MRLRLYLHSKEGAATLPKKFHHGLGSLIQSLANTAAGHLDSEPRLFCVSPPLWKEVETLKDTIRLKDGGSIICGSADTEQLNRTCNNREMDFARQSLPGCPFFDAGISGLQTPTLVATEAITRTKQPRPNSDLCALCKEAKPLVNSHLVPRFFLRAATSEVREGTRAGKREASVMHFGERPVGRDI